jgi:hypothetical protein
MSRKLEREVRFVAAFDRRVSRPVRRERIV